MRVIDTLLRDELPVRCDVGLDLAPSSAPVGGCIGPADYHCGLWAIARRAGPLPPLLAVNYMACVP
ncbi:MAG: hypothetical protein DLM62_04050 [Pseudonocardiales bacterium]|nr:MAG: hypothetical protein DLM62_04050 [Pseudonocardiales bacterium]